MQRSFLQEAMQDEDSMSVREFLAKTMDHYRHFTDRVIDKMFSDMDENGDGSISAEDAERVFEETGVPHIDLAPLFSDFVASRKPPLKEGEQLGMMDQLNAEIAVGVKIPFFHVSARVGKLPCIIEFLLHRREYCNFPREVIRFMLDSVDK